ncbi:ankyrin [Thozetella sp. PMI_491]|nr:ankyrin [Thozetella sp. PMI_491]
MTSDDTTLMHSLLGLRRPNVDIDSKDKNGKTPLHYACEMHFSSEKVISILLSAGADPSVKDSFGKTPIHYTIQHYRFERLTAILEAAESWMSNNQAPEIMRRIIRHGANVNDKSNNGRTALHFACAAGYLDRAQVLLQHGAIPNELDQDGRTPLEIAPNPSEEAELSWKVLFSGFTD